MRVRRHSPWVALDNGQRRDILGGHRVGTGTAPHSRGHICSGANPCGWMNEYRLPGQLVISLTRISRS